MRALDGLTRVIPDQQPVRQEVPEGKVSRGSMASAALEWLDEQRMAGSSTEQLERWQNDLEDLFNPVGDFFTPEELDDQISLIRSPGRGTLERFFGWLEKTDGYPAPVALTAPPRPYVLQ